MLGKDTMPDLVAVVTQIHGTPTSEGAIREHRVLVDRPTTKGGLDRGPWAVSCCWPGSAEAS
jgi:hypothetical protein